MQLYTVHRIMIAAGIALCVIFGLRELVVVEAEERSILLAAGAFVVAAALSFYLRAFIRKTAGDDA